MHKAYCSSVEKDWEDYDQEALKEDPELRTQCAITK